MGDLVGDLAAAAQIGLMVLRALWNWAMTWPKEAFIIIAAAMALYIAYNWYASEFSWWSIRGVLTLAALAAFVFMLFLFVG